MSEYTVYDEDFKSYPGAPVGDKESVLKWMQSQFPVLEEGDDDELIPAKVFFFEGDLTTYRAADGEKFYLAEVIEEEEDEDDNEREEARLMTAEEFFKDCEDEEE